MKFKIMNHITLKALVINGVHYVFSKLMMVSSIEIYAMMHIMWLCLFVLCINKTMAVDIMIRPW